MMKIDHIRTFFEPDDLHNNRTLARLSKMVNVAQEFILTEYQQGHVRR